MSWAGSLQEHHLVQDVNQIEEPAIGEAYLGTRALRSLTHSGQVSSISPTNMKQGTVEDSIHTMQQMLAEVKDSQERLEQRLECFIHGQLSSANTDKSSSSVANGSSNNKALEKLVESCQSRLDEILGKMQVSGKEHIPMSPLPGNDQQPATSTTKTGHHLREQLGAEGIPASASTLKTGASVNTTADNMVEKGTGLFEGIDTKQLSLDEEEDQTAWDNFQKSLRGHGHKHSRLYKEISERKGKDTSIWHELFEYFGLGSFLATDPPDTVLARAVSHSYFSIASGVLVLANACLMGYDTDASIKVALQQPGAHEIQWMPTCMLFFNIAFALELLIKIAALGSWFFASPDDWTWNMFDLFVVVISVVGEMLRGMNFSFVRSLRMLRAARAARIIRVFRAFRELRKMLLAMLASLKSLVWVFLFLSMLIAMVSILLLQGLTAALEDMKQNSTEYLQAKQNILLWYGSMGDAMFSLIRAITGGAEWYAVYEPLEIANALYGIIFILFVLFVLVGIMNVLTGVFLANAGDSTDRDLLIQDYRVRVESFVRMMMDLFAEIDLSGTGDIDWETFIKSMENESVQAALAASGLEPLHANLIFDLLDEHNDGKINLLDFVMGIMSLKGSATSVDARVILRELGMFPQILGTHLSKLKHHVLASKATPV